MWNKTVGLEGQKCTPKYLQGDLLQPKHCGFVLLVNYFYTTRFVTFNQPLWAKSSLAIWISLSHIHCECTCFSQNIRNYEKKKIKKRCIQGKKGIRTLNILTRRDNFVFMTRLQSCGTAKETATSFWKALQLWSLVNLHNWLCAMPLLEGATVLPWQCCNCNAVVLRSYAMSLWVLWVKITEKKKTHIKDKVIFTDWRSTQQQVYVQPRKCTTHAQTS